MNLNLAELRLHIKQLSHGDNPRLKNRLLALIELCKRSESNNFTDFDYEIIALRFDVSTRTIYRWVKLYLSGGIKALAPNSSPGRKKRIINGWTARLIGEMRHNYGWGADVIKAHLKEYHNINLSKWFIHYYLTQKELINFRRIPTKKLHTKIVKVEDPGRHTQLDIKHLPRILSNGQKCYVYNFVDHASRWQFKRAYDGYGPYYTEKFMQELLLTCPFKILRLQTDNGIEFTNKFLSHLDNPKEHILDKICNQNKIIKKLIPAGEKELNGLVERSHRMDDEELYFSIKPTNVAELNERLKKHCEWLNSYRLRKPLGWITANTYLKIWTQSLFDLSRENRTDTDTINQKIVA